MSLLKKGFLVCCCLVLFCFNTSAQSQDKIPIKSIVVFGDSLSDIGNTTHLLKSLRREEDPKYLVAPLKVYVLRKMDRLAEKYYIPVTVLFMAKGLVTTFFDSDVGPLIATVASRIKEAPVIPAAPYWNYHFSNGYVWDEYLAQSLGLNLTDPSQFDNHAFGGSWAAAYDKQFTVWNLIRHPINTIKALINGKLIPPSVPLTLQAYLTVYEKANPDSVYFLFAGGNDYLNVLNFEDNYNPAVYSKYVDNVIDYLESSVNKLISAGMKHLVVMGSPNIGIAPRFVYTTDRDVLTKIIGLHNQRLQAAIEQWRRDNPEVKITFVNTQAMLDDALKDPEAYGITDTTHGCTSVILPRAYYGAEPTEGHPFANNFVLEYAQQFSESKSLNGGEQNFTLCNDADKYLFWDEAHPTTVAHKFLAQRTCEALADEGYAMDCTAYFG